jgi:hypothetical protein
MGTFCNFNGVVGIVNMLLLLMSLKLVERTLTLPVIMSSMLDAINWLLFLPIGESRFFGERFQREGLSNHTQPTSKPLFPILPPQHFALQ